MEDYEKTFEDFWQLIVCNPDGSLNLDQVKRELHDYHTVLSQKYLRCTTMLQKKQ
jgi:hypothetical protein